MAITKRKYFVIEKNLRKILWFYGSYCFSFVLVHLLLISVFTFFHFLLDHEMGAIENWISLNGWEIIVLAKLISLGLIAKIIQVNTYKQFNFLDEIRDAVTLPSKKSISIVFFMIVMFYSLLIQFGGGIQSNKVWEDLFFSSFLGSCLFYSFDILCIGLIIKYFDLKITEPIKIFIFCLLFFVISSKIVLPYMDKYSFFLVIHFASIFYLGYHRNIGDLLLYLFFIIAPQSAFFGIDLVWDNSYSVFSHKDNIPLLGTLGIWGIALGYYRYSRLD
jgi:hypothetical protein